MLNNYLTTHHSFDSGVTLIGKRKFGMMRLLLIITALTCVITFIGNQRMQATMDSSEVIELLNSENRVKGEELNKVISKYRHIGFNLTVAQSQSLPAFEVSGRKVHSAFDDKAMYYIVYNEADDAIRAIKLLDLKKES